jgi:hypothetical protein
MGRTHHINVSEKRNVCRSRRESTPGPSNSIIIFRINFRPSIYLSRGFQRCWKTNREVFMSPLIFLRFQTKGEPISALLCGIMHGRMVILYRHFVTKYRPQLNGPRPSKIGEIRCPGAAFYPRKAQISLKSRWKPEIGNC